MIFEAIDSIFNVAILNAGITLPIVTENVGYDREADVPYLATYILPAPVFQATLGKNGCDRHTGIYQIDINGESGQGVTFLKQTADSLNQIFKSGEVFTDGVTSIHIQNVSIERVRVEGGMATLSMSIEYWANSPRG